MLTYSEIQLMIFRWRCVSYVHADYKYLKSLYQYSRVPVTHLLLLSTYSKIFTMYYIFLSLLLSDCFVLFIHTIFKEYRIIFCTVNEAFVRYCLFLHFRDYGHSYSVSRSCQCLRFYRRPISLAFWLRLRIFRGIICTPFCSQRFHFVKSAIYLST